MAELMRKTNNGWALYDGEGNLVLTIESGAANLGNPIQIGHSHNDREMRDIREILQDFEDRISNLETCLRADTKILMADSSEKELKDVKYGDMVMGWDLDNHCPFPVKAYGAISTGTDNVWFYHVFSNGAILEISKKHGIYSKTKGRCSSSTKWAAGEVGIDVGGNDVMLAFTDKVEEASYSPTYTIVTENNTYFANGILCANNPASKMRYYSMGIHKYNKNITKEDVEFFKLTATQNDDSMKLRVNTKSYLKESAPYYTELHLTKHYISELKKKLDAGDYKTIKHAEGKLDAETFAAHCEQTQSYRDQIAVYEKTCETLIAKIAEIKKKHSVGATSEDASKRWKRLYDLDMAYIRANRK